MNDDPLFDQFLEDKYYDSDKTPGTIEDIERKIKEIKQSVQDCNDIEGVESIKELSHEDIHHILEHLKAQGKSEATVNNHHLKYLKAIIEYGHDLNKLPNSHTPVKTARNIHEYNSQHESNYPEIDHSELSQFLQDETDRRPLRPQERAVWVLSLKTGLRLGEVINLDLQDLHISYAPLNNHEQYADIEYHRTIEDYPDSLYVTSGITEGDEYRGEEREYGNKRNETTIIPLDGEMKHALVRWLAARPPTPHINADPLFLNFGSNPYTRANKHHISKITVKEAANELGWNDRKPPEDFDFEEYNNITHKWFRHYFTTKMRDPVDGMGILYTSYFRGDSKPGSVAEDSTEVSADPYTDLSWLNLREHYRNNIYQFGLPTLPV